MDPAEAARRATENRGPQAAAIIISFTVIAFVALLLRYATRFFITKRPGIEDACIGVAVIFSICMSVCQVEQVRFGSGKHVEVVTKEETFESLRYLFYSIHAYNLGLTFTKSAILLLYLRIFSFKATRVLCYIVLTIVIMYGIQAILTGIFTCIPVQAFWDKTIPNPTCIPEFTLFYANAAICISSDIAIVLLPMHPITKLQMPKRQKIILMVILALGGFVCVVSILRLYALVVLDRSKDPTWEQPATAYWSAIELNVGIVCGCLPTLRPLVNKIAPHMFTLATSARSQPPYGSNGGSGYPSVFGNGRGRRDAYGKFNDEQSYETIVIGGMPGKNGQSFHSNDDTVGLTANRQSPMQAHLPPARPARTDDPYGW